MIPLFEASVVKFTETGSRMVVSRGWEEGRRERCSVGTEFPGNLPPSFSFIRWKSSGDLLYNNVHILGTTELYV